MVQGGTIAATDAADPVVSTATVKARAYVQNAGWKGWAKQGKTVGTTSGKGLRAIKIRLADLGDLSGSINYIARDKGKGWGSAVANGKSTGRTDTPIQAIKIWLTGDIANHYDVLYRIRIAGKGWQPWVKNKAKAGVSGANAYATAVQVKLSPKTEAAAGKGAQTVGVRYEARLASSGWKSWVGDGKTAGSASAKKKMDRLVIKASAGNVGGSIQYRGYVQGKKWSDWLSSGKVVGKANKRLEAVKIQLTGNLASTYDVYYRVYVPGYKWLGWAKNGTEAGARGYRLSIAAIQVKLLKKGAAGAPTVNGLSTVASLAKNLDGIDISSWQAGLNPKTVPSDFVIVKATQSTNYTNPYFKKWADAVLASGKLLGAYHFAVKGNATKQADYFLKVVGPYVGKCVLVLDWENTQTSDTLSQGPAWAKKFLDRVYKKTGVRPLVYMSISVTNAYAWDSVAENYELWVAHYLYRNMLKSGYTTNPYRIEDGCGAWGNPTMYQYSSVGQLSGYSGNLDLNVFYGTRSDWETLAAEQ